MCLLSHKHFNLPMYALQEALADKQIIYSVQAQIKCALCKMQLSLSILAVQQNTRVLCKPALLFYSERSMQLLVESFGCQASGSLKMTIDSISPIFSPSSFVKTALEG